MKKYIELHEKTRNATHLLIELRYNLGGFNYFTYKQEPRGYYLSVSPVTLEQRDGYTLESFTAFTGTKYLVKEVTRKSEKAEKEAEQRAQEIEKALINFVCTQNNLAIPT
jgi:hypothetical protein